MINTSICLKPTVHFCPNNILRSGLFSSYILLSIFFLLPVQEANAQREMPNHNRGILMQCLVIEGDTFFYQMLPTYVFLSPKTFRSKREQEQYNRLVRNVKRVYPYARLAGIKLKEYNEILLVTPSERERKALMKKAEAELEAQFGKELKKLTFSQGVILLKLIDRETGQTGYELVAELRGTFRAFFWQSLGRLFGYNLRVRYDPKGSDRDIEDIVLRIMYGQL